jgi:molybdopterin synthase catalytic subunit
MKKPVVELSERPVDDHVCFGSDRHGAEIQFRGVVRAQEDGKKLIGIRYSAYAPMAQRKLEVVIEEALIQQPDALIYLHHRLGLVEAGVASVLIAVAMPHSRAAYDLSQSILHRLKTEVPIWKECVWEGR